MTDKETRTQATQKVVGSKIGGALRQVNNAEVSDQSIDNTTAASTDQESRSEGGFNFGSGRAKGKYGIIALAIVLLVAAIVGLLKVTLAR